MTACFVNTCWSEDPINNSENTCCAPSGFSTVIAFNIIQEILYIFANMKASLLASISRKSHFPVSSWPYNIRTW